LATYFHQGSGILLATPIIFFFVEVKGLAS